MSRTWTQLRVQVAESAGVAAAGRALERSREALVRALDHLNRRAIFPCLRVVGQIVLEAGTRDYDPPEAFGVHDSEVGSYLLDVAGTKRSSSVGFAEEDDFLRMGWDVTARTGLPAVMMLRRSDAKIVLDKIPRAEDDGRIVRIPYFRKILVPADDDDTLEVDDRMEDVVVAHGIWLLQKAARVKDWQDSRELAIRAEAEMLAERTTTAG